MKTCREWASIAAPALLAVGCSGGGSQQGGSGVITDLEYALIDTGDYQHSLAVLHQSGESVFFESSSPDELPTSLSYRRHPDDPAVHLAIAPSGLPDYLFVEGWFAVFGNWSSDQTRVDVALIGPDGTIDVVRDLDVPAQLWPGWLEWSPYDVVRWAGHALGGYHCIAAIAATTSTSGAAFPLLLLGCGGTIAGIMAEFEDEDGDVTSAELADLSGALGLFHCGASGLGQGNWAPCIEFAVLQINSYLEHVDHEVEVHSDDIALATAALEHGHGDFQATLTWDTTADLDLWVTDPYGETIRWSNPSSASGGQLDRDDTDGFGPENIFWPPGAAPEGDYLVQVHHWSGASPSGYSVLVQVGVQSYAFSGTIWDAELVTIGSFTLPDNPSMAAGTLPFATRVFYDPQREK